jgi:hypothetical protein
MALVGVALGVSKQDEGGRPVSNCERTSRDYMFCLSLLASAERNPADVTESGVSEFLELLVGSDLQHY